MMDWYEGQEALEVLQGMHLQWFGDVAVDDDEVGDEGPVDDADDDPDEEEDIPLYLEGRDELPEEEETGPDPLELQAKLEAAQAEKAAYEARLADREAMTSGFSELAKVFKEQASVQGQAAQQQAPGESWDAVKKRLSKSFYDDPVGAMEEAMRYMVANDIAPAFQTLKGELSKTAMTASRQAATMSETNKMIMERYRDEVEEAVKQLPASPDVYEKACQQVGMNHLTDLVAMQVEAATVAAKAPKRPTSNVKPGGGPASRGTGAKAPKRRVLTKAQQEAADRMGLSYEAYWNVMNG